MRTTEAGLVALGAALAFAVSACTGGRAPEVTPGVGASGAIGTAAPEPSRAAGSDQPSSEPMATGGKPLILPPYDAPAFWLNVAPGGLNAERYGDVASMVREADAVVLGSVVEAVESRPIPDDEGAGYGLLRFRVERPIAGELVEVEPGIIQVEFYLSQRSHLSRFSDPPDERVVLFLRNKAVEAQQAGVDPAGPLAGREYYRVVSAQGYLRDLDGRTAVPLASEYAWLAELDGLPFEDTLALIEEHAP